MKAVGYINSYKTNKLEREIEIKIQREKIYDYCTKNSIKLINLYEEPSNSREDYKPSLMKMLKEASNGSFNKVIVIKIDNFSRDNSVKTWIADELKKFAVVIHSTNEKLVSKPVLNDDSVLKKTNDIKQKVKNIPSLPEVVTKVAELVQNPNSSASQLGKVISHDPGLTGRVLRLVNSAYYGFPKQISSIQHAITILGFTTIRGLVLTSSIFKMFSPVSSVSLFDYKKFWKHSLISAIAAKQVKTYLTVSEKGEEDIFSAAILHDIGKIILDQYDHENYAKTFTTKIFTKISDPFIFNKVLNAEEEFCGVNHADIGHAVAEGWNLPDSLTDVIKYHHNPLGSKNNVLLTSMVCIGNIFAHIILENVEGGVNIKLFDPEILSYLGLNEDDLDKLNMLIVEEVQNMGNLESFFK